MIKKFIFTLILLTSVSGINLIYAQDTDGDGIANTADLDDDNDGIPDALECPGNNIVTNGTFTGSAAGWTLNPNWVYGGNKIYIDNQNVSNADATQTLTNLGNTNNIIPVTLTLGATDGNQSAGSTASLQILLNGVVYATIDNSTTRSTTTNNVTITLSNGATSNFVPFTTANINGETFSTFTLNIPNGSVPNTANLTFRATTAVDDWSIDNVSVLAFTCDTDNDGIFNHLDLDSDGDGCFDAIEGDEKVLLNQLNSNGSINIAANGGIGTTAGTNNGVPNLVNSGGAADIGADVGQGVGDSQNATVTTQCLDSDGDGVQNEFDLDDDNDGILDVNETVCATSNSASFNPNTQAWQSTGTNMVAGRTYKLQMTGSSLGLVTASGGANNGKQFYPAGFSSSDSRVSDYNGYRYNLPTGGSTATYNSDPQPSVDVTFANLMAADYSNILTFVGMIDNNGNGQYNPGIDVLVPKILDMSQGPAGGVTFTAQTNGTFYIVYADNNYTDNSGTFNFVMQTCGIDIDTDGDGIPNRLDLDSDGDGCTDAIEGGANFTSANLVTATGAIATQTPNQNLGNTIGNTPATLGVPTIAGTGQSVGESQNAVRNDCIDADNDGFPDWQDLDDDNDGILDTAECPPVNTFANFTPATIATPNSTTTNVTGISFGSITGSLSVVNFGTTYFTPVTKSSMDMASATLYTPTGSTTQSALTEAEGNFNNTTNFTRYTLTLNAPAESVTLHINNFDFMRTRFTGAHVEQLLSGGTELVYNPATRQLYDSDPNTFSTPARDGYGSIKITSTNGQPLTQIVFEKFDDPNTTQAGDGYFYTFSVEPSCDADGDGIPNRLDLDSDGDGCTDAIEGGANFTSTNLVTATGTIATQTPNQNLGNTVGSTATTVGVPTIAGTGQSVGQSQDSTRNDCLDADNDGFPDWQDLDDDNDGILDTAEGICDTQSVYTLNMASTLAGATFGANGGNFNLVYTLTSGTAVASLGNSFTVPFSYSDLNNAVNAQNHTWASFGTTATNFLIIPNVTSLYTGVPANNSTSEDPSGASPNTPDGYFRYFLNTNRITQLGTFTTTIGNLPSVSGLSSYSSNTSLNLFSSFNASGNTVINSGYYAKMQLQNNVNTANVAGTLPLSVNYSSTYTWDYTAFTDTPGSGPASAGRGLITIAQNTVTFCNHRDTDGDGTPDYLDLDSDGDGCFDALEGDENVTVNQLNANGSINTTTTGGLGAAATNAGVPNLVNSGGAADIGGDVGQGIGDSQNALVNTCYCYKKPVLNAGITNPTRHGITALNRANSGTTDWPIVRQSAWTVLEANTKGFVVNRVAFSDADSNPATPMTPVGIATANYLEGMMVYDTTNNCLKIYNGTVWNCYTTQTCPQ